MIRRNLIKTAIGAGLLPLCNVFGADFSPNSSKSEFEDIAAKIEVWLPDNSNTELALWENSLFCCKKLINDIHNNDKVITSNGLFNRYMTIMLAGYQAKSLSKKVMILTAPEKAPFLRNRFKILGLNHRNIFIFGGTNGFYEKMDIGYCFDKSLSYMRKDTRAISKMKEIYSTE